MRQEDTKQMRQLNMMIPKKNRWEDMRQEHYTWDNTKREENKRDKTNEKRRKQ